VGSLGQREGELARAGAEGKRAGCRAQPMRGEKRRGESWAAGEEEEMGQRGPCGEKRRERAREKRGESKVGRAKKRVWLPFVYSFSSPFLILYSTNSNKSN
jgi:hypothetical protein